MPLNFISGQLADCSELVGKTIRSISDITPNGNIMAGYLVEFTDGDVLHIDSYDGGVMLLEPQK